MEKQEKIGFHKGALDCLIKERKELSRLISIVDSLIKVHLKGLEDEGVDVKAMLRKAKEGSGQKEESVPEPIEPADNPEEHFTDFSKLLKKKEE